MNKQEKADLCVVRPLSDSSFEVDSSSGLTYFVTTFTQHSSARCNCPWGEIHGESSCENGCSHMMAVWAHVTNQGEQIDFYEMIDAAGEAYWSARQAGYSEEDAAAAADSMIGYYE